MSITLKFKNDQLVFLDKINIVKKSVYTEFLTKIKKYKSLDSLFINDKSYIKKQAKKLLKKFDIYTEIDVVENIDFYQEETLINLFSHYLNNLTDVKLEDSYIFKFEELLNEFNINPLSQYNKISLGQKVLVNIIIAICFGYKVIFCNQMLIHLSSENKTKLNLICSKMNFSIVSYSLFIDNETLFEEYNEETVNDNLVSKKKLHSKSNLHNNLLIGLISSTLICLTSTGLIFSKSNGIYQTYKKDFSNKTVQLDFLNYTQTYLHNIYYDKSGNLMYHFSPFSNAQIDIKFVPIEYYSKTENRFYYLGNNQAAISSNLKSELLLDESYSNIKKILNLDQDFTTINSSDNFVLLNAELYSQFYTSFQHGGVIYYKMKKLDQNLEYYSLDKTTRIDYQNLDHSKFYIPLDFDENCVYPDNFQSSNSNLGGYYKSKDKLNAVIYDYEIFEVLMQLPHPNNKIVLNINKLNNIDKEYYNYFNKWTDNSLDAYKEVIADYDQKLTIFLSTLFAFTFMSISTYIPLDIYLVKKEKAKYKLMIK